MKTNKGFTIIELLVVISIIAMVSSIVLASVNKSRSRARDVRRAHDLRQIEKALELYFDDYGAYPITTAWFGVSVNGGSRGITGPGGYVPNLAPTYIPVLPVDPLDIRTDWSGYLYHSLTGEQYSLLAHYKGPESWPGPGDLFYDANRPFSAWKLCTGEPQCSY